MYTYKQGSMCVLLPCNYQLCSTLFILSSEMYVYALVIPLSSVGHRPRVYTWTYMNTYIQFCTYMCMYVPTANKVKSTAAIRSITLSYTVLHRTYTAGSFSTGTGNLTRFKDLWIDTSWTLIDLMWAPVAAITLNNPSLPIPLRSNEPAPHHILWCSRGSGPQPFNICCDDVTSYS